MVLGIILMVPLGTLIGVDMLPMEGLVPIAAGLIGSLGLGARDWLLERPGSGRWVRLGLLLGGLFALLVAGTQVIVRGVSAMRVRWRRPAVWIKQARALEHRQERKRGRSPYREFDRRRVDPFDYSVFARIKPYSTKSAARDHCLIAAFFNRTT